MEEVKVFAQLLAPQYGIAVHNSLTANNFLLKRLLRKTKRLFIGSTYSISMFISILLQSRRDSLERFIGVSSATSVTLTSRNISAFQTVLRAKL